MIPTQNELKEAIKIACKKLITELFTTKEDFYYISLITDGEAHAPFLTAWSHQALNRVLNENNIKINSEEALDIKWFYGDSPYTFFKSEYFKEVNRLFELRPMMNEKMNNNEWEREFNLRISAMEKALSELDNENLFGKDEVRNKIMINVEVVPPDETNTKRAIKLNPKKAIKEWLEVVAE